jgi:lipopolysaccharide transport system permease protein
MNYLKKLYESRHFWVHLSSADIRAKYRRSYFGVLWSLLQPLAMTLLLSFVMSKLFKTPIVDYAPYIFSGIIFWEFIVGSAIAGSNAFINAEGYIKQVSLPLLIYTLRSTLSAFINLLLAFVGLVIWVLIWKHETLGFAWLTLLPSFLLIFMFGFLLGTITAFVNTKYRDFQQMLALILQALWYVSPIFFQPKLFSSVDAKYLLDFNPIYHLLNLFRAPMLDATTPALINFLVIIGVILFLFGIVTLLVNKSEKKVIFYL